jgi:fatty acid kinase fatty acid binding subunit
VSQVKIVTDSNAHLPDPDLVAELGIEVVPLTVWIGAQAYPERINFTDEAFLRRLIKDPGSVSVEAPSVSQIRGVFGRLGQSADKIVCIHASGALSDVADVARQAAASYAGRQRIVILDTATTSVGIGLIVEAAARAAADGASLAEVVRIVRGMIPHMYALILSDSLEYLEAWGRLGPAQTLLGTMLGLKPIAMMEDGDLLPIEKVRTYGRAVDKLFEFIFEFSHIEQMYLLQHEFETEAAQLLERLELTYPDREFPVIGYPPSLAVHIGPRALGVLVYEGAR